jgi:hypothetical protein
VKAEDAQATAKPDEPECPECDGLRWIWEYGIEEKWPVQCPRCNWGCQHGEPYELAYGK